VQRFYWSGVARMGRMIRCFKREKVVRVMMAGKIRKASCTRPGESSTLLPDLRTLRFWYRRRRDNRDDTFAARPDRGICHGKACVSNPRWNYARTCFVPAGILTRRPLIAREERDIDFGWELAKGNGAAGCRQSVAVKERAVLAVEAIEGTDRAIARAGEFCRAGASWL